MNETPPHHTFQGAIAVVALLNLAYFGVEFTVALVIDSVSLFADSVDFLEDASVNFLILLALGWSAVWRARVGMTLAGILLVPAVATLWTAWGKLVNPIPPEPVSLTLAAAGALAINLVCAWLLVRHRHIEGSLSKAAFLSARNDALANIGIIVAGFATAWTASTWPDLIVGLAIIAINTDAAHEVWSAAKDEHLSATTQGERVTRRCPVASQERFPRRKEPCHARKLVACPHSVSGCPPRTGR